MGNICGQHQEASLPNIKKAVIFDEPPTSPVHIDILPSAEFEQKCSQMLQLQISAFNLAQFGKKLSANALVSNKKISKLVSTAEGKLGFLREKRRSDPSYVFDEADSLRSALEGLGKSGFNRDEETVKEFNEQLNAMEDQAEEALEYLATVGAMKHLEYRQALQVRELELVGQKIVTFLEQAGAARSEIERIQKDMYRDLIRAPELLQEVDDLKERSEDESVEEEELYFGTEETVEMQSEVPLIRVRDSLGVDYANILALIHAQHWKDHLTPFEPAAVLRIFSKVLAQCDPQQLSLADTVRQIFKRRFKDESEQAIAQFLEGLRLWVSPKQPYSGWVADVMRIFTARPLSLPVLRQVVLLNQALEPVTIHTWNDVESRHRDLATGGLIPLTTVCRILSPLFLHFPQYSPKLWDSLKPPHVTDPDYLHFLVVFHMQLSEIDAVTLFKRMTPTSRLSSDALRSGLASILHLTLSDASFDQLLELMQNPESKIIRRLDLLKFVRLEMYIAHKDSVAFRIPRFQVLSVFTEACRMRRRELAALFRAQLPVPVTTEAVIKAVRALGDTSDLSEVMKVKVDSVEKALKVLELRGVSLGRYFCMR